MAMSAPAMLHTYDTQMMDYPSDIDVSMHSSTSDSWFLGEVSMGDDLHISKSHLSDRANVTVEVDMEDWGGESIEYEMADEAEAHYGGDDLVDVEVYDASQVHTPAAFDIDTTRLLPDGVSGQVHSSPSFTPSILTPMVSDNLHVVEEVHVDETVGLPEDMLYSSVVEPLVALSSQTEFREEILDDPAATAAIAHESSLLPVTDDIKAAFEGVSEPATSVNVPDSNHHNTVYNEGPDAVIPLEPQAHHPDRHAISDIDHVELVSHNEVGEYRQEHEHAHDPTEATIDPHEISEGVYIDPPPAVLLSLPLSDEPGIYLFNRPLPESGSSSPSAAVEKSEQSTIILLHQRPTLYYEPLTSVFEAFRQEEHISRIPGFADGELLIDAYDLQLSITEDNIYAREVSLHDLNVLHDGSDFSGPLRLHLQSVVPRFILRYHSLQGQVASLNIVAEAVEPSSGEQDERKDHDQAGVHDGFPVREEGEDGNPNDLDEQQVGKLQEILHQDSSEANVPKEQVIGEISNLPNEYPEPQDLPEETSHLFDNPVGYTEVAVEAEAEGATSESFYDGVSPGAPSVEAEYTQYGERLDPTLETDRVYGESPQEPASGGEQPTTYDEYQGLGESTTFEEAPHSSDDSAVLVSSASGDGESALPRQGAQAEYDDEERKSWSFIEQSKPDPKFEVPDTKEEIASLHTERDGADEPSSHSAALLERQVEGADLPSDPSSSVLHAKPDKPSDIPDIYEDEWDDELDGEGEIDTAWELEHDAQSNESSVTLSSKTSSKRTYGQVDIEEESGNDENDDTLPLNSGPKRPRVQ